MRVAASKKRYVLRPPREIGAGSGDFFIYPGKTVRHSYWWGPLGNGPQFAFAAPAAPYATVGTRVISSNQAVEQLNGIVYTVDVTCDDMGTDMGASYLIEVGALA